MKKLSIYLIISLLTLGINSCGETGLYQNIETENAYNSVSDVKNGLTGAYSAFASYRFFGKNVPAIGDFAADISVANAGSGHFVAINNYGITETGGEFQQVWDYGYKVIDRCVRAIKGGNALLATTSDGEEQFELHSVISQSYALKALTEFYLVNIFGLPYKTGEANSQPGIVLIKEEPIEAFENVSRSSVNDTYLLIKEQINKAKENYEKSLSLNEKHRLNEFYFNLSAIYAFEAQLALFMGDYDQAIISAQKSLEEKGKHEVSNEIYIEMWSSIAINNEDIFTLAKSENDNLSANALNTLYGSYKGSISYFARDSVFKGKKDIRKDLIQTYAEANQPSKWQGTSTAQAVSNIPVYRASGMYLIQAEAYANKNDIINAQNALLYTAKRDSLITTVTELPSEQEALLEFIAIENVREFFSEGHRWFDLRRTNKPFTFKGKEFNVAQFVFPIPADEINAGFGVTQNEKWDAAIPD